MDVLEITGIVKDSSGIISHCGVKGYGIHPIAIIYKLIREEIYSFFIYNRESKMKVYAKTSPGGPIFLTTDPNGADMDKLNLLPLLDKPLLRQFIESVR